MKRLALFGAAVGVGALIAAGTAVWLRERRRKSVFAAADAPALLNPLRHLLMPIGFTLRTFGVKSGETVLELGPGPGYFTIAAGRMVGPAGRIVCIDIQREMLHQLLPRLEAEGVNNVHALVGDAQALPIRSATIDRAFLVTVLGEVPDASLAVKELARLLRPAGVLAFCETLLDPDYVRAGTLRDLCAAAGFRETKHVWVGHGYIACFRRA